MVLCIRAKISDISTGCTNALQCPPQNSQWCTLCLYHRARSRQLLLWYCTNPDHDDWGHARTCPHAQTCPVLIVHSQPFGFPFRFSCILNILLSISGTRFHVTVAVSSIGGHADSRDLSLSQADELPDAASAALAFEQHSTALLSACIPEPPDVALAALHKAFGLG